LQTATELEASHLSQHLAVLRRHRLVESERRGIHVYYPLAVRRTGELLPAACGLLLTMLAGDEVRLSEASTLPRLPGTRPRCTHPRCCDMPAACCPRSPTTVRHDGPGRRTCWPVRPSASLPSRWPSASVSAPD